MVKPPGPNVQGALVIAGSDKRGTIYGIYDLSEQMGVSPWYWWADVPVSPHDALVRESRADTSQGPPAVKYRGIFLNDEAPALSGWTQEKFGGFNHELYTNVFELLLRLKANYLWPAMWDNSFATDDPLNARLADEYGIVMGTSHHEPMMRAWKEWNARATARTVGTIPRTTRSLRALLGRRARGAHKDYEKVITLGMRGDGDEPMAETESVALLERIVADQRKIIGERDQARTSARCRKVWALYKEVQGYYERGMRVPDDVTLLWCDDNWGNLRRLPTPEERKRSGGAGIYYHFDYVGGPRNYKWLNTIPLPKVWEQMNLAYHYGADRLWIVNVGDLKPMEVPMEFFLTFAWNPERWTKNDLDDSTCAFGPRANSARNTRRTSPTWSPNTRNTTAGANRSCSSRTRSASMNYGEADRVVAEWQSAAGTRRSRSPPSSLPSRATRSSSSCCTRSRRAHRQRALRRGGEEPPVCRPGPRHGQRLRRQDARFVPGGRRTH